MPLRLDCSGATALEYALIAVFISIICVGWATFVGTSVSSMFMRVASGF
jgi:Flp pilus assembly pilin Flp